MTDRTAHPDRSSSSFPAPAGPRLPARLRGRRPLVVPPAVGHRLGGGS
ncbi:hypothetical protein [Blastococcus haudaquaticus]|nr:hypothetical protein [Blastococcus haudaquaticus]